MMRNSQLVVIFGLFLVIVGLSFGVAQAQSASTVFTYQGRLSDGDVPAEGSYDFQFRLYDAPTAGTLIEPVITRNEVIVQDGLFLVVLDFGDIFDGSARYLDLSVRPSDSTGEFTVLTPRQEFTAAPMAIFSSNSQVSDSTLALQGQPITTTTPLDDQVLKWDGSQWAPSVDQDTTYTDGSGLNLVGTRFEVRFGGDGDSTRVARSDHNHVGQTWRDSENGNVLTIENTHTGRWSRGIYSQAVNADGVEGRSVSRTGVFGHSVSGAGVFALSESFRGLEAGGSEIGVLGFTTDSNGWAGVFDGNVTVFDHLYKAGGSFLIDHPLDPENKYLLHSFVESPDMMNIYNGNVTLDANGEATVTLPDYFEALNIEYRYQLTPIGAPGPNLYIATEISNNQFAIAGGTPGGSVSWQVTGVRNDRYARENRIVVEQDKPEAERGTYIYEPETTLQNETETTLQGDSDSTSVIHGRPMPSAPSDADIAEPMAPTQP